MTKTAGRLYITQQTLSNHIQRLEQYYGTPLLYRKPALSLTCAGEFVRDFAHGVGREESNLKDIITDISHQERGVLRFGASMARGTQFLPRVLPQLYRRYPLVEVRFTDGLSAKLEQQLTDGDLNFAIVLTREHNDSVAEETLLQDAVYLCVPEALLQAHYAPEEIVQIKERSAQGVQIEDFSRLPFALMDNRLGSWMNGYFARRSFTPPVRFTGTYTNQILPLCLEGLAACYCTHSSLVECRDRLGQGINVLPLLEQDRPVVQTLSLLRCRQRHMTHYAQYFMELLFQAAVSMEQVQVARIV